MYKKLNILDEKDKRLRLISKDVVFPIDDKEKEIIEKAIEELRLSQIEVYSEKYNLRPGMGLAAIQLGIQKRWFVLVEDLGEDLEEDERFRSYFFANPKIISSSAELIYAEQGEGCLSVNREVEGIILRNARVTVEAYDVDGNKITQRLREDMAIAVQHEMDHLDGKLFYDRINKSNPFKDSDKYRGI